MENSNTFTSERKKLAIELAQNGFVVILLNGKAPCIKDWQKKVSTTVEEIEEWFSNNPNTTNIGLVLGRISNIVGIDVDGKGGYKLLEQLSNGDLPDTVTFNTGSGGIRYLYQIPKSHKDLPFKKFTETDTTQQHTECALLGDGQQTVLPYSIHPNGKVYEFIEGKSFDEIKLVDAPSWMIEKMTSSVTSLPSLPKNSTSQVVAAPPAPAGRNISNEHNSNVLLEILHRCKALKYLYREQSETGLCEDKWYSVVNLLVSCDLEDAALEFSKLSSKHNTRSEERIRLLKNKNNTQKGYIRCSTLGCSPENIVDCMGYKNTNAKGEITNSPFRRITYNSLNNIKIGFHYNDDGKFTGINGNVFANHILNNFNIRMKNETIFYIYCDSYWKKINMTYIQKILYKFFHNYEQNKWSSSIENMYMPALIRQCKYVDELTTSTEYICLENGLLNIKTLHLDKHTDKIFSTFKVPIKYDINEQCPQFMAFINDIFDNDSQLVCLIQEIMGYCLCMSTKTQKLFMFLGEGANGKSILCEVITSLCGTENISSIPLNGLSKDSKMAQIVDKVLNISTESDMRIDSSGVQLLKAVSSGDTIQINQKYEPTYSYTPYAKLIFCTNRLPSITDKSYGFSRRLILIPFNKTYYDNPTDSSQPKADKSLIDKLLPELNGIFNFAIEGLKRLRSNDYVFSHCQTSKELLEEYKLDINPYLDFIRFAIEVGESADRIETKNFHQAFTQWCHKNNHNQLANATARTFLKEIRTTLKNENISITEGKSNGSNYFNGIKFTNECCKESSFLTSKPTPVTVQIPKPEKPVIKLNNVDEIANQFSTQKKN